MNWSTSHDTIPIPSTTYTVGSTGFWTDVVSTIDPSSTVYIPNGIEVIVNSGINTGNIVAQGKLTIATGVALQVESIYIGVSGELYVATTGNLTITFKDAPINTGLDPSQYGHGLISFGKVSMYGNTKTPFVKVGHEISAGQSGVNLVSIPTNWKAGDQLLISDSRYIAEFIRSSTIVSQSEVVSIANISNSSLYVTPAFTYDHLGASDLSGVLIFTPYMVNLTRNIELKSAGTSGVIRGHTFYTDRADVDIRYCKFTDMGRTQGFVAVDSTTFNASGQVTHIGTNQIGRYSIHAHHLYGPSGSPQPNGYQFTFMGNSFVDNYPKLGAKVRWPIAIHDSHYGLISGNVIFNTIDAGVAFEDGSESQNVLDGNYVCTMYTVKDRAEAGGYWFRGVNNRVRNNIASDCQFFAEAQTVYGFTYNLQQLGNVVIPPSQGLVPSQTVYMNEREILEFSNNEIFCSQGGITCWWVGIYGSPLPPVNSFTGNSIISGTKMWKLWKNGFFGYPIKNMTWLDTTMINPRFVLDLNDYNIGLEFSDYNIENFVMKDFKIEGWRVGIGFTTYPLKQQYLINGILRNQTNVEIYTPYSVNGAPNVSGIIYIFDNCIFGKITGKPFHSIRMYYTPQDGANIIARTDVYVYNFNRDPNLNFKLFVPQQAESFITPHSQYFSNPTRPMIGAPVSGLTNKQNLETYDKCVFGRVMPTSSLIIPASSLGLFNCYAYWIPANSGGYPSAMKQFTDHMRDGGYYTKTGRTFNSGDYFAQTFPIL